MALFFCLRNVVFEIRDPCCYQRSERRQLGTERHVAAHFVTTARFVTTGIAARFVTLVKKRAVVTKLAVVTKRAATRHRSSLPSKTTAYSGKARPATNERHLKDGSCCTN